MKKYLIAREPNESYFPLLLKFERLGDTGTGCPEYFSLQGKQELLQSRHES
jgi:hypothetical protein